MKVGTLSDRLANRVVRHFPAQRLRIAPERAVVSFTFDDAPETAWTHGAPVLEAAGARGTYYVCGGLAGTMLEGRALIPSDGYADLAARGHELACHTFSHGKLASYRRERLRADLDRNAAFLEELDGRSDRRNFAVPYTMSWPPAQSELRRRFTTSRGGQRGINRGQVDPFNLLTMELRDGGLPREVSDALLDDLAVRPGWLIFLTHDVAEEPMPFGCTTDRFARLVEAIAMRGFPILTVDAAIDMLGMRTHPSP